MNANSFTPGPWFACREGFSTIYIEARIGGRLLQEVAACGPTNEGQGQQEANARLISAAPDLLEALESYVTTMAIAGGGDKALFMAAIREADNKARAAIAKATGAQP